MSVNLPQPQRDARLPALTLDEIRGRLARVPAVSIGEPGDAEVFSRLNDERALTPAAVLILMLRRETMLRVVFTQRTAHLHDHAGQISFPGGRQDPGDETLVATALREAREEIGMDTSNVEILGQLPEYVTITGYRVTPVVGASDPPAEFAPDSFEVADVFEVPLDFLLDPANHQRNFYVRNGAKRHFWAMPYEGRYIWGATAGMLRTFYEVLSRPA